MWVWTVGRLFHVKPRPHLLGLFTAMLAFFSRGFSATKRNQKMKKWLDEGGWGQRRENYEEENGEAEEETRSKNRVDKKEDGEKMEKWKWKKKKEKDD